MSFKLEWDPGAENEMAAFWVPANSNLRSDTTRASYLIDRLLEKDPLNEGESRPDGKRIMFEWPLGTIFEVAHESNLVRVLHDWLIKRKRALVNMITTLLHAAPSLPQWAPGT